MSGSKPGERRGGRQRDTFNKSTLQCLEADAGRKKAIDHLDECLASIPA